VTWSTILADNTNDPRDAVQRPGARHRRIDLPCSTDLTTQLFTLAEARAILDNPVLDKRYQETPLGAEIAKFLYIFEHEENKSPESVRDYEPPLAHIALDNPTLGILDFTPPAGIELLRTCMARHWTTTPNGTPTSARTRKKIRSIWVSFFDWAVTNAGLPGNPARAIGTPKLRNVERKTFTEQFVRKILAQQEYVGDWVLCYLILRYGLRRSGIQNIQFKHFDFESRELTVFTKDGRIYVIPIVEPKFWRRLGELQLEAQLGDDAFLVYRQDTRHRRVPLEEATEMLMLRGEPVGYADVTTRVHSAKRPSGQTVHRWWYRCLGRAGVVDVGVTRGANMHRGRHTTGRAVQRAKHDLKITQLILGHADIKTTSIYADLDTADLAAALRQMDRDEED
jgi:site-specific recombinase XerC